jgi:hypothetical protein
MRSTAASTASGTSAARRSTGACAEQLPVEVANMSSIWTVCYTQPSRYNWMLQYYLRAEGLALSWVGTGPLIFSLNYTEADFAAVADRFVAAAKAMKEDGWWWHVPADQQVDQADDPEGNDRPPIAFAARRPEPTLAGRSAIQLGRGSSSASSSSHSASRYAGSIIRRATGQSGALW